MLRREAKSKGLPRYFTGKPCKYGHISEKKTCNGTCIECAKERDEQNPVYKLEYNKKRYQEQTEYILEQNRKWREENSEYKKEIDKKWDKENREKKNAQEAKHRAAKLQRTPIWGDYLKIEEVYLEAYNKTKETGIRYEVDHIIPLQGKLVSGLHIDNNLQVITKKANCSKGNRFQI